MAMSRDQKTGQFHYTKIENSSLEWVEEARFLGTTLMDQNFHSGSNYEQFEVRE
jgi:hypothetical protein